MKKQLIIIIIFLVAFASNAQEEEIKKVLSAQIDCWNKGDITCFMQGYLNSEELIFVSSNGLKYGWKMTLNNYKKNYPNRVAMGILGFDLLKFQSIGKNHYLVVGKWILQRKNDTLEGYFSIIFKKIKGEWKIIADHSS